MVEFVDCFNSIGLQYQSVLPVKIKTKPCLWIMRRKKSSSTTAEMKDRVRQRMLEYKLKQQLDNNQTEVIVDTPSSEASEIRAPTERIGNELQNDIDLEPVNIESVHRKSRNSAKLKAMVVSHYRSRGRIVEDYNGSGETSSDNSVEPNVESPSVMASPPAAATPKVSMKLNIKRIIKAEKIREMVERISTIDLHETCDLERMSTKDCLRKLIDDYDEESD